VQGVPHQGFGRAMKVGREEIAGLIVALQRFVAGSDQDDIDSGNRTVDLVADALGELPGVTSVRHALPRKPMPQLWLELDEESLGLTAYDVVNQMLTGDPPIVLAESRAEFGTLIVHPAGLADEEATLVGTRLRQVLSNNGAV
jgi:L-seryl-tRNA(Ser) seleniumtransferase